MSDVKRFSVFAFTDRHNHDYRAEQIPFYNVPAVADRLIRKGYDRMLFELEPGVVHHSCSDPNCPGGCSDG